MKSELGFDLSQELFEALKNTYKQTEGEHLPQAKKYKKGENIYKEGNVPKGIFFIKSGTVKLTHTSPFNKTVTIRFASKHDFIGYLSLIKHWDYVTTATAMEGSQVYFIPKKIFTQVIHSDNKFTAILLDILCNRITESDKTLIHILTKEVIQRLALLLLSINHSKLMDPGHVDGIIRIPKKDLASILNISAETLSRNLGKLSKEKAIKLQNKTSIIEIISKQKLLQLSRVND
ncbi:MAG: Crp/Fnr family transcriptional regulator [Bacteroidetes bacterium]|nr:Crp/Fnr family transcriptional regulator [Bacteroidota bacterium]